MLRASESDRSRLESVIRTPRLLRFVASLDRPRELEVILRERWSDDRASDRDESFDRPEEVIDRERESWREREPLLDERSEPPREMLLRLLSDERGVNERFELEERSELPREMLLRLLSGERE